MSGRYERLFRGVLYPAYETLLRRRGTLAYLAEYERNQWLSADHIAALRWRKLLALVQWCQREVPYWRRRFRAIGFEPGDLRTPDDYARLPTIDKDEVRAHFDELKATSLANQLLYKSTGGSTGTPLRFAYDRESAERRNAVMWRGYGWAGARMGRRALYLWGGNLGRRPLTQRLKERAYHAMFGRRMLDCFAMREDNLARYADTFASYRPEVVVGYVMPLVLLARWLLDSGRRLPAPEAILTGAEPLLDAQRQLIEAAFGAPVYNTYGCREVMLIASECEHRNGLHINADHLYVETLAPEPGTDAGEVVLTDLHNRGMPLLRYRNGDLARPLAGVCGCGRGLPRLAAVTGRRLDLIRTPDGRVLPGEFFPHLMKDVPAIRQFQVVQTRIDRIEVRVVPAGPLDDASLAFARAEIAKALGAGVEVDIQPVERIALTPSGKFRVTVSELG